MMPEFNELSVLGKSKNLSWLRNFRPVLLAVLKAVEQPPERGVSCGAWRFQRFRGSGLRWAPYS